MNTFDRVGSCLYVLCLLSVLVFAGGGFDLLTGVSFLCRLCVYVN